MWLLGRIHTKESHTAEIYWDMSFLASILHMDFASVSVLGKLYQFSTQLLLEVLVAWYGSVIRGLWWIAGML